MALARWNGVIQDDDGNAIEGASVEVRRHVTGMPLGVPYSDLLGASPKGNPFLSAADGDASFHIVGGFYQIRAYLGPSSAPTFEKIWSYVGIGTAQGLDANSLTNAVPVGAWADTPTSYSLNDLVEHEGYNFLSNEDSNEGNEPATNPPASDAHWTWLPIDQSALPEVALTSSAGSVAINGASGTFFAINPLGENTTLANMTNPVVGRCGRIRVVQDGTGGRTMAFGSNYKWQNGVAGILSTGAGDVDVILYDVIASNYILLAIMKDLG